MQDVPAKKVWERLADFPGKEEALLVLNDLEDLSCFHKGGGLAEMVRRLGTSKLLITTCNANLRQVLGSACRCFELKRDANEHHVMFKLMARLALGSDPGPLHERPPIPRDVKVCSGLVRPSCVRFSKAWGQHRIVDGSRIQQHIHVRQMRSVCTSSGSCYFLVLPVQAWV